MDTTTIILTIVGSIFASTGFWAFVTYLMQRRDKKGSTAGKLRRGLAHDRICYLGAVYIKQGYISTDDYENLHDYLYLPYEELGGNGTAKRIMDEVKKLPLRDKK
jgi:hypothetical protein